MNFWSFYWIAWLGAFLGPEIWALVSNPYNTFSENYWRLEDLNKTQPLDFAFWTNVHWAAALLVWVLWTWLSLHLPFGFLR